MAKKPSKATSEKRTDGILRLPMLYKRTELGAIQTWQMCVEGDRFWSVEGIKDGTLTTNKPTVCVGKNIGRANETTPEEQALKEAQAKWTKKSESGYVDELDDVDETRAYFAPMLCHDYNKYSERVSAALARGEAVYVQPKLDGMRCIARRDGLWSRNGKLIVSVPHILEALNPLFGADQELILDGELYCDKLKNDFNEIMHHVRQTRPTAEDLVASARVIQYWVYDLPSCKKSFGERKAALARLFTQLDLIKGDRVGMLVQVPTLQSESQKEMDEAYERWIEAGMEGQIIRLDAPYEQKRSRSILKRKEFQTEEYPIVDVCEGVGNRAGTAGYMVLGLKDGRTFKSNIKSDLVRLAKVWENRRRYINKSATCKFFALTPDGVPRFPFVIDVNREAFE